MPNFANHPDPLPGQQLDLIESYFEDRVEKLELDSGAVAFVQRPKPKAEGATASAADLPDLIDVDTISANSNEIYRISIGPLEIVISYDPVNWGVDISVKINIPFFGGITVGQISGNLKQGVTLKIGYKAILSGEVGVQLDGSDVYLIFEFSAFGSSYKDRIKLFSI